MHNGLSIYQQVLSDHISRLPCLSYIIFNRPVVDKTTLRLKLQQAYY